MSPTLQGFLVRLYEWLTCADLPGDGDLVFALAGRQSRKSYALEMFSQGRVPQLLLSVGRFEIRRFDDLPLPFRMNLPQRAASVAPPQRHFFVYIDNTTSAAQLIRTGRFGTMSEIRALNAWLAVREGIKSVLIVSSAAHLRRVRLCCRSLLPSAIQFRLLAVEEEGSGLRRDLWWRTAKTRSIVLAEFPKLLLYWLVLRLRSTIRNMASWFKTRVGLRDRLG